MSFLIPFLLGCYVGPIYFAYFNFFASIQLSDYPIWKLRLFAAFAALFWPVIEVYATFRALREMAKDMDKPKEL